MGSTIDKIKGRLKEALGVITDNDRLKREGQEGSGCGGGERQSGAGSGEDEGRSGEERINI